MTLRTENATPPKSSKSTNSNSSAQIQFEPKSQFEFVTQDTEEFEILDVVDSKDVVFSVETVVLERSIELFTLH